MNMSQFAIALLATLLLGGGFIVHRRKLKQLAATGDAYLSLIQNSSDVFYRTDPPGRLLLVSQAALDLLGFSSMSEVLHQPMTSFWMHPEQRSAMLGAISRHGAVRDYEVTLRRVDGSPVVVAVSCNYYRNLRGEIMGVEGMFRDITDRKKAEAALQEAERKYRELFELAPVAIFNATMDGRFLTVNPEYARMIGYHSPQQMVESVTDIATQLYADPADRIPYLNALRAHGRVSNFEVRLKRLTGEIFWAAMTTRAHRDAQGGVESIYGFIVDITRQKEEAAFRARMHEELEQQVATRTLELERSNRRLRELDELKTNFLSSASHELRTPLTSILGFAKITGKTFDRYLQGTPAPPPALRAKAETIRSNLNIIAKEGLRLARLVNDLLDVNRIESGAVEWRIEPVDVATLLKEASLAVAGNLAQRPELTLAITVDPALPPLHTDRDRMHQVLLNLLHNAIKFTPHGAIRLQAGLAQALPDMVELVVEDDGPGIAAEDLELVFEKFYQSRSQSFGLLARGDGTPHGAGLGLTISKQIVEHLGGSIRAQSPPDSGARFVLHLPSTAAEAAPPIIPAAD